MLHRTDRLAVGAIAAGAALGHVLVSAIVVLVTPLAPPESLGDSDARTVLRFVDVEPEGATVILHREDQRVRYHVTDGSSVGFDENEFVGRLTTSGRLGTIRAEFEVLRGGVAVGHGFIDAFRPRIEVSGNGFGVSGLWSIPRRGNLDYGLPPHMTSDRLGLSAIPGGLLCSTRLRRTFAQFS